MKGMTMAVQPGIPCSAPHAHRAPSGSGRVEWGYAPEEVHRAVEALTGPVCAAATASAGMNAQLAATLDVPAGKVFVKAMPQAHPRALVGRPWAYPRHCLSGAAS